MHGRASGVEMNPPLTRGVDLAVQIATLRDLTLQAGGEMISATRQRCLEPHSEL